MAATVTDARADTRMTPAAGATAMAPAPVRRVERDPGRDRWHLALSVAAWGVALLGWAVALAGSPRRQFVLAAVVIGATCALCTSLTAVWVAHNQRIHRRKGPRTGLPNARVEYATDWLGRAVTTHWSLVQRAPEIVISAGGQWKAIWPARSEMRSPGPERPG